MMLRTPAATAALLALAAAAPAQLPPVSVASGVGNFGPGTRPRTPSLAAPVGRPRVFGGGYYAAPYYGYGYAPYYGYGLGYPSPYDPVPYAPYPEPAVVPVYVPPPDPPIRLSGEGPARLTLTFPAPAEVWLNGEKVEGEAAAERVLTSPQLRPAERFTFRVRARWRADGQTYEFTRELALGPNERSRVGVFAGTPVDGK
ncbi:MAG: hypothetical protein K2P78_08330 [Gemmataceae bacterium]|nr:hypothetical protein [Gemmataceae bacterium]